MCIKHHPYVMVLHVKSIKLQSIWCNTRGVGKLGGKWHCSQNPVIRFPPQGDPLILCTWFAWILEEEVTLGHLSDMFANVLSGSFEDWGIVERGFSDSSFGALSVRPLTLKEGNYGSQRPGKRQSINVVIRKWASIYCLIKRIQYMHLIKVPCSKDFCFLFSFDVCPMEILVLVFTPWEFQVLISISSGGPHQGEPWTQPHFMLPKLPSSENLILKYFLKCCFPSLYWILFVVVSKNRTTRM